MSGPAPRTFDLSSGEIALLLESRMTVGGVIRAQRKTKAYRYALHLEKPGLLERNPCAPGVAEVRITRLGEQLLRASFHVVL